MCLLFAPVVDHIIKANNHLLFPDFVKSVFARRPETPRSPKPRRSVATAIATQTEHGHVQTNNLLRLLIFNIFLLIPSFFAHFRPLLASLGLNVVISRDQLIFPPREMPYALISRVGSQLLTYRIERRPMSHFLLSTPDMRHEGWRQMKHPSYGSTSGITTLRCILHHDLSSKGGLRWYFLYWHSYLGHLFLALGDLCCYWGNQSTITRCRRQSSISARWCGSSSAGGWCHCCRCDSGSTHILSASLNVQGVYEGGAHGEAPGGGSSLSKNDDSRFRKTRVTGGRGRVRTPLYLVLTAHAVRSSEADFKQGCCVQSTRGCSVLHRLFGHSSRRSPVSYPLQCGGDFDCAAD